MTHAPISARRRAHAFCAIGCLAVLAACGAQPVRGGTGGAGAPVFASTLTDTSINVSQRVSLGTFGGWRAYHSPTEPVGCGIARAVDDMHVFVDALPAYHREYFVTFYSSRFPRARSGVAVVVDAAFGTRDVGRSTTIRAAGRTTNMTDDSHSGVTFLRNAGELILMADAEAFAVDVTDLNFDSQVFDLGDFAAGLTALATCVRERL